MGLDNFWYHEDWTEDDSEALDPELMPTPPDEVNLCGGLFTGSGNGSFRGKVYDEFMEIATGETLFQHTIQPSTVEQMAEELRKVDWSMVDTEHFRRPEDEEEYEDLTRMFEFYADRGAQLHGWW